MAHLDNYNDGAQHMLMLRIYGLSIIYVKDTSRKNSLEGSRIDLALGIERYWKI